MGNSILKPPQRLRWYAVRCASKRVVEKVEKRVKRLGITQFIPRAWRMEKQGQWMVAVDDGYLIPPFIFVAMRAPGHWKSRNSALWGELADLPGVVEIMGNRARNGDRTPIAVPYREMRKIRTEHRRGESYLAGERFKHGQKVKVTAGAFAGFDGIFDKPERERVRIFLSLFCAERDVVLKEADIRAA